MLAIVLSSHADDGAAGDGISLVLLVFVVLRMVVYCWSLWSFAWWLEGQHLTLASWHMLGCLGQL
jgi:hypothetical protein